MSGLRGLAQTLVLPVLKASRFDMRCARLRLNELGARHAEVSALFSLDDSPGAPNERLIDLLLALITRTRNVSLSSLSERNPPDLLHKWPGQHYRLLAALVQELRPRNIVEIGTLTGLSALSMLAHLPPESKLATFDIIPWNKIPGTYLRPGDFASGQLTQILADLKDPETCRAHATLLQSCDLIFADGPKDGIFEQRLLENFDSIGLRPHTVLIFDDIRAWNMLGIWRKISCPKLDITSVGHHMGTGLVEWLPLAERTSI